MYLVLTVPFMQFLVYKVCFEISLLLSAKYFKDRGINLIVAFQQINTYLIE